MVKNLDAVITTVRLYKLKSKLFHIFNNISNYFRGIIFYSIFAKQNCKCEIFGKAFFSGSHIFRIFTDNFPEIRSIIIE